MYLRAIDFLRDDRHRTNMNRLYELFYYINKNHLNDSCPLSVGILRVSPSKYWFDLWDGIEYVGKKNERRKIMNHGLFDDWGFKYHPGKENLEQTVILYDIAMLEGLPFINGEAAHPVQDKNGPKYTHLSTLGDSALNWWNPSRSVSTFDNRPNYHGTKSRVKIRLRGRDESSGPVYLNVFDVPHLKYGGRALIYLECAQNYYRYFRPVGHMLWYLVDSLSNASWDSLMPSEATINLAHAQPDRFENRTVFLRLTSGFFMDNDRLDKLRLSLRSLNVSASPDLVKTTAVLTFLQVR